MSRFQDNIETVTCEVEAKTPGFEDKIERSEIGAETPGFDAKMERVTCEVEAKTPGFEDNSYL